MYRVSKPPTTAIHDAVTHRPPNSANRDFPASTTQPVARPVSSDVAQGPAVSVRDIATSDLDVVFQPIVDLSTGLSFALEALTRCKWPEFKNPVKLFAQAQQEQCCGSLGRKVREVAFSR